MDVLFCGYFIGNTLILQLTLDLEGEKNMLQGYGPLAGKFSIGQARLKYIFLSILGMFRILEKNNFF